MKTIRRSPGNRGQGRKRMDKEKKRVRVSVNIPPTIYDKVVGFQDETGDSISSTVVWLLDQAIAQKTKNF